MKIIYDAQRDAIRFLLSDAPIKRTSTAAAGTLLDFDDQERLVGLEVSPASDLIPDPRLLQAVAVNVLAEPSAAAEGTDESGL